MTTAETRPPRRIRRPGQRRTQNPDGAMTFVEHLREFRSRMFKSVLAICAGAVIGWIYYDQLFDLLREPFEAIRDEAVAEGKERPQLALAGVVDPFTLQLKIAFTAGFVLSAPIWLYQLWAFITPGLRSAERRWGLVFVAGALPLFLSGIALAYFLLPTGISVLLGFTPEGVSNIINVSEYLSFFIRMLLVFGVAFLLPVIIVMLNLVGVLSAARLSSWWRGIILGIVVFAAIATPTGDPINMMFLASPMLILTAVAFAICWLNDRRRSRRDRSQFEDWDDDETSPLEP